MNKKLLTLLQTKCKDFGLSKNAIEDLAKSGSEGITDETSEEDIEKIADSLVPYARLMQAEVTRKAQKSNPNPKPNKPAKTADEADENDGEGDGKGKTGDDDEPAWFKAYKAEQERKMKALETENANIRAEKAKAERSAAIAAKAKELGIPEVMMKHFSIADDADIDAILSEYKQDLVTSKLMPASSASITSSSEQAAKDDAKAWAQTLPDN